MYINTMGLLGSVGDVHTRKRLDTYIAHVFREKVLKSLANRIALCYDALSAIIPCA